MFFFQKGSDVLVSIRKSSNKFTIFRIEAIDKISIKYPFDFLLIDFDFSIFIANNQLLIITLLSNLLLEFLLIVVVNARVADLTNFEERATIESTLPYKYSSLFDNFISEYRFLTV